MVAALEGLETSLGTFPTSWSSDAQLAGLAGQPIVTKGCVVHYDSNGQSALGRALREIAGIPLNREDQSGSTKFRKSAEWKRYAAAGSSVPDYLKEIIAIKNKDAQLDAHEIKIVKHLLRVFTSPTAALLIRTSFAEIQTALLEVEPSKTAPARPRLLIGLASAFCSIADTEVLSKGILPASSIDDVFSHGNDRLSFTFDDADDRRVNLMRYLVSAAERLGLNAQKLETALGHLSKSRRSKARAKDGTPERTAQVLNKLTHLLMCRDGVALSMSYDLPPRIAPLVKVTDGTLYQERVRNGYNELFTSVEKQALKEAIKPQIAAGRTTFSAVEAVPYVNAVSACTRTRESLSVLFYSSFPHLLFELLEQGYSMLPLANGKIDKYNIRIDQLRFGDGTLVSTHPSPIHQPSVDAYRRKHPVVQNAAPASATGSATASFSSAGPTTSLSAPIASSSSAVPSSSFVPSATVSRPAPRAASSTTSTASKPTRHRAPPRPTRIEGLDSDDEDRIDVKGKGKAKAVDFADEDSSDSSDESASDNEEIVQRSKKRLRRGQAGDAPLLASESPPLVPNDATPSTRLRPRSSELSGTVNGDAFARLKAARARRLGLGHA